MFTNPPTAGFCTEEAVPLVSVSVNEAEQDSAIDPEKRAASIRFPLTIVPKLTMLLGSSVATERVMSFTPSVPPTAEPSIVMVSPTL